MRISDWSSDVCSSDLAYQDLSDTAAGYVMILVVDDAQIDAGYRAAGRSQKTCTVVLVLEARHNGGAFGLAVGLCDARQDTGRVGNECVRTWNAGWLPYVSTKHSKHIHMRVLDVKL